MRGKNPRCRHTASSRKKRRAFRRNHCRTPDWYNYDFPTPHRHSWKGKYRARPKWLPGALPDRTVNQSGAYRPQAEFDNGAGRNDEMLDLNRAFKSRSMKSMPRWHLGQRYLHVIFVVMEFSSTVRKCRWMSISPCWRKRHRSNRGGIHTDLWARLLNHGHRLERDTNGRCRRSRRPQGRHELDLYRRDLKPVPGVIPMLKNLLAQKHRHQWPRDRALEHSA